MVVTGILITSLFGLGLDWRWISAISAIDPLVFLVAMIFVPETPYYLIKKGITFIKKIRFFFKYNFISFIQAHHLSDGTMHLRLMYSCISQVVI